MIALLFYPPDPARAEAAVLKYRVRSSDTLSGILYRLDYAPIYGSRGLLRQSLDMNPNIVVTEGDRLMPGQVLTLPGSAPGHQSHPSQSHQPASVSVSTTPARVLATTPTPEPTPVPASASPSTPIPTPTPAPVAVSAPALDTDRASAALSLGLGITYFKIASIDAASGDGASLLSNASPSVSAQFLLRWDDELTFVAGGRLAKYSLLSLNNNQGFSSDSGTLTGVSLGFQYTGWKRLTLGASVRYEQEIFFHAASLTSLQTDLIGIAKPVAILSYELLQKTNASVGIDGEYGYLMPTSNSVYNIAGGTHLMFGGHLIYQMPSGNSVKMLMQFNRDRQNEAAATHEDQNLTFQFLYLWELP